MLKNSFSCLPTTFTFPQTKGEEPLGNVLEFYGGNQSKMREPEDFEREDDDQTRGLDFRQELGKLNKHLKGNYVVVNRAAVPNMDEEWALSFWETAQYRG